MHLHADSVDMVWRRLIRAVSGGFLDRRPHLDRYAKAGNCSDQRCAGRSASTRTNPRNCCLSTAELNVRIHSPPAASQVRTRAGRRRSGGNRYFRQPRVCRQVGAIGRSDRRNCTIRIVSIRKIIIGRMKAIERRPLALSSTVPPTSIV